MTISNVILTRWIFESLKFGAEGVAHDVSFEYQPDLLVSDGADAIVNGARLVWGNVARAMCWAHVVPKVQKNLCKIPDKDHQAEMMKGIIEIQLASDQLEFSKMVRLYDQKWRTAGLEYGVFLDYFQEVLHVVNVGMGQPSWRMV